MLLLLLLFFTLDISQWLIALVALVNPLPDDKMLNWSKLKQIADDIFKVHLRWTLSTCTI